MAARAAFRSFANLYASEPYWVKKKPCRTVVLDWSSVVIT